MRIQSIPLDEMAKCCPKPVVGRPYTESEAMALAVDLAWGGLDGASPNPMVGAVALDGNGCLLGSGFHSIVGGPHAEVAMWQNIQENYPNKSDLGGARIFVSLEPCSHHGRTPPCAELLIKLKPASVTYLMRDPNPLVFGRGAKMLQEAGIRAIEVVGPKEIARKQNEAFFERQRSGQKIFVGLKAATSLGGSIASKGDQRRWLTSERARRFGHFLRTRYDAIAIGASTLIQDDPMLDPSMFDRRARSPWKVVIDPNLRGAEHFLARGVTPQLTLSEPAKVVWISSDVFAKTKNEAHAALSHLGVHFVQLPPAERRFSAAEILKSLESYPIASLLLEGGAGLYGAFMDERLVRRAHLFMAPKFLGTTHQQIHIESGRHLNEELNLTDIDLTPLDEDLLIEGWL